MTAFLDCLKQLEEKITSQDNEFSLPYKINQHKLEDKNGSSYSIKFQLNSFEEWTKALKYMLTNLKWSLAWVISNENSQREREIIKTGTTSFHFILLFQYSISPSTSCYLKYYKYCLMYKYFIYYYIFGFFYFTSIFFCFHFEWFFIKFNLYLNKFIFKTQLNLF